MTTRAKLYRRHDGLGEAFPADVVDEWAGRVLLLGGAVWAMAIVSAVVIVLELS